MRRQAAARQGGAARTRFLADVLRGLSARPRSLPSRYLYDFRGSELFRRITRLPAYYLTRSEREILVRHGAELVAPFAGRACTLVDLGAGDGTKSELLLARLLACSPAVTYAPVDVCAGALDAAAGRMRACCPGLQVAPVQAEYGDALPQLEGGWPGAPGLDAAPGSRPAAARLVLFLGSSIGNLTHPEALGLLRALRNALRPGDHLLVGFDLLKDRATLQRAYDDEDGVTAEFNLNLLARLDRELGADFDPGGFRHQARFAGGPARMESFLVSTRRQTVTLAGHPLRFAEGSAIRTEISCKYREAQVTALARAAGLAEVGHFLDERRWFLDALWRVPGS